MSGQRARIAVGEAGARRMAERALAAPARPSFAVTGRSDAPPSSGRSLDPETRASMEARFRHSFADVGILAGGEAGESALGLGADAYTYGRSIVFAPGRYAPGSDSGRALIAHELAHVVQQRGVPPRVQRQQAPQTRPFDRGYELYLSAGGTLYSRSTGRYELSDFDLAHLVRRAGFYFLVTDRISLITPPEVRRAAPTGVRGAGVLLEISAADFAAVSASPDATVARVVRDGLGITVPRMTHATGPDRDYSRPELPAPMTQALQAPGSAEGAAARRRAAGTVQEPTLAIASARGQDLPIHEIGRADLMSQAEVLGTMSVGARADWYVQKLGRYQAQLHASAQRHHIPTQLLAVVILNELADINIVDVLQSGEGADWGSLGIAQIQVTTAMAENLVDVTPAEAEAAYRQQLRRMGHEHDPHRALTEYERRAGRRLRVGRQLQVPQVAIEAAAREIEILINRMGANRNSPWQRRFTFRASGVAGDAIYDSVGPPNTPRAAREGMLAMMVSGAYNSPNVIDTGNPSGFRNALVHGTNAQTHAIQLYRLGLFRTAGGAAARTTPAQPPTAARTGPAAVTGMRFSGSQLTLHGGPTVASFAAVSGLRPSNPHNRDRRDHTGRRSQGIPDVGPIPEGSYFVNPGEVQRTGFNQTVWGPLRVPIRESFMTEIHRRWHTSRTGGFFVHEDVRRDGTAGCVGLQRRPDTVTVFARFGATTEQIPLEVRYPRTAGPPRH